MTSRAAGPTDEERAEFKRGELQAVRDLMCNHDLDYDLETLAVHVESFMDPMGTEEPSYLRGKQAGLKLAAALIRDRISSSSATEPYSVEPTTTAYIKETPFSVAWAAVEKVLPEGWAQVVGSIVDRSLHDPLRIVYWAGAGPDEDDPDTMIGGFSSPTAALRALAARLSESPSEGNTE